MVGSIISFTANDFVVRGVSITGSEGGAWAGLDAEFVRRVDAFGRTMERGRAAAD